MIVGRSVALAAIVAAVVACGSNEEPAGAASPVAPTATTEPTVVAPVSETQEPTAVPEPTETGAVAAPVSLPLPKRSGPRPETTGFIPHVQMNVNPVAEVDDELRRRTFALPEVEHRPDRVSLEGTEGVWIAVGVDVPRPDGISGDRQLTHIHPDGSLHIRLPYERALEATNAGWSVLHPSVNLSTLEGDVLLVMLYTPLSMEELDVTFQLIVDSYNYATGRSIDPSDFESEG